MINSDWKAIRVKSPAGTWYIARTHKEANRLGERRRKEPNGKSKGRAVFFREELNHAVASLEKLTDSERQKWLGEIIDIKEAIEGAVVTRVSINTFREHKV